MTYPHRRPAAMASTLPLPPLPLPPLADGEHGAGIMPVALPLQTGPCGGNSPTYQITPLDSQVYPNQLDCVAKTTLPPPEADRAGAHLPWYQPAYMADCEGAHVAWYQPGYMAKAIPLPPDRRVQVTSPLQPQQLQLGGQYPTQVVYPTSVVQQAGARYTLGCCSYNVASSNGLDASNPAWILPSTERSPV